MFRGAVVSGSWPLTICASPPPVSTTPAALPPRPTPGGRRDWRGGKLHALRPVFLELGIPAALVYDRPPLEPPPDDDESLTALSLLERILGAHPIPA